METQMPMLEKMAAVKEQSQVCGEFLEFLLGKYIILGRRDNSGNFYYVGAGDIEKTLAEFFGIDLEQAEREKQEILRSLNH